MCGVEHGDGAPGPVEGEDCSEFGFAQRHWARRGGGCWVKGKEAPEIGFVEGREFVKVEGEEEAGEETRLDVGDKGVVCKEFPKPM